MRVSRKTDYALRALFTLVDHYGGAPIPIRELARRNDVPKRFLEQIMLDLKAQGRVDRLAGVRGGYVLGKSPEKITMGQVVRHFDGILAPIDCVSVTGYKRCSQEPVCRFRRVFYDARNFVAGLMTVRPWPISPRAPPFPTRKSPPAIPGATEYKKVDLGVDKNQADVNIRLT